MLKKLFKIESDRAKLSNIYFNFLQYPIITLGVFYLLFFIVEIIDLVIEIITFEPEIIMFYFLRFILLVINFAMLAIFITFTCITYSAKKGSKEVNKHYFYLLIENYKRIIIIWTICLLGVSVPRMYLLLNNKDLIGIFVRILVYLKIFLLIPFYLMTIIIYIIANEVRYKDVDNI